MSTFDFEKEYGKPAGKMSAAEFRMATLNQLHDINEHLDDLNGKTKCIPRHELYFKLIGIVVFLSVSAVIGVLVSQAIGG